MQDMASSSSEPWLLSLNMDDLQAEYMARFGNPRIFRVPAYIRNLKPRNYDPVILPLGMYNRDFREKTPMDQLKLEIVNAFLRHLQIDHNQWSRFCREVAHAKGQVLGPDAPGFIHFYQDDGRPSFLTPELQLSVIIIDTLFIVAVLIAVFTWRIQIGPDETWCLGPRPLIEHILEIFTRRGVACHLNAFILDILWLYEGQLPLFLVQNVWAKVINKAPRIDHGAQSVGFDYVIVRLPQLLRDAGFPYKGDVKVQFNECEHLLACLHRALCTGTHSMENNSATRPLKDNDTIIGRFKSYMRKVPFVMQPFTELMVSTVRSVKGRYLIMTRNGSSAVVRSLPSATCLRRAGIHFKGVETNISDIRFVKSFFHLTATLFLPKMLFDDFSERLLLNLCAYEHMNIGTALRMPVTGFVALMDELIDSAEDVDLLMRGNDPVIVANLLGDNKELANLFSNMLQNFCYPRNQRLYSIRTQIITWYNVRWRRHLIGFLDRFTTAPWLLVSLIAATILLVLTLLQTIYTM